MQTISQIAQQIVAREGGFVDDPDDPGGATNFGVTIRTMRALGLDLDGDGEIGVSDVRRMTRAQAADIFIEHYFRRPRIDTLPEVLQASVFDMQVNAGANAVRILQRLLREMGQVELLVSLCYVVFLGIIGALMFVESVRALRRTKGGKLPPRRKHNWVHNLPLKMKFRTSGLYISVIPPVLVGLSVGLLAAIMGVGGGFIMVPAMLYILNMPTNVVIGTSLFQVIFVTAIATVLHAAANQTVDIVLAMLLVAGGVVGAQLGARAGRRLKGEQLRALLALIVLGVCGKLLFDLTTPPVSPFIVETAS